MAITKSVRETIEVLDDGTLQVKFTSEFLEDGQPTGATQIHREVLHPGASTAGRSARVALIAGAVWTPAVIAQYRARRAAADAALDARMAAIRGDG